MPNLLQEYHLDSPERMTLHFLISGLGSRILRLQYGHNDSILLCRLMLVCDDVLYAMGLELFVSNKQTVLGYFAFFGYLCLAMDLLLALGGLLEWARASVISVSS